MRLIIRITISFICLSLLTSCCQRDVSSIDVIEISTIGASPLVFENMFESVEILLLDNNEEFPLQSVTKMLCWNELYYLYNSTGQGEQVIVYDLEGRLIRALSQNGKGPQEYAKIEDIDINLNTGELLVLDPIIKKLLVFDRNLNFVKSHKFAKVQNPRLAAFCPWNMDEYIVSTMTNITSANQNYKINVQDFEESYHKGYLPYSEPVIGGSGGQFQLQKHSSTVSFLPRFSNKIYQISKDTCEPSYNLEFDRPTMPEGVRNVSFEYPNCIFNQKFLESDDLIVFQVIYNELIYETHFSKEHGNSKTVITMYRDVENDDRVSLFPIGFANERLVYFSNSSEIMNLIRNVDPHLRCISNPEILDSINIVEGTGILMFVKHKY